MASSQPDSTPGSVSPEPPMSTPEQFSLEQPPKRKGGRRLLQSLHASSPALHETVQILLKWISSRRQAVPLLCLLVFLRLWPIMSGRTESVPARRTASGAGLQFPTNRHRRPYHRLRRRRRRQKERTLGYGSLEPFQTCPRRPCRFWPSCDRRIQRERETGLPAVENGTVNNVNNGPITVSPRVEAEDRFLERYAH
jgi:hypothetical protein